MIWKRTPLGIALALALVLALSACTAGNAPAQSAAPATTAPAIAAPTVEATPSPQPEEIATPTPTATPTPDAPAQGNVLVAYFSHTGNTEAVAEQIAERTGGTLAQIQRAEEYADLQQEIDFKRKKRSCRACGRRSPSAWTTSRNTTRSLSATPSGGTRRRP